MFVLPAAYLYGNVEPSLRRSVIVPRSRLFVHEPRVMGVDVVVDDHVLDAQRHQLVARVAEHLARVAVRGDVRTVLVRDENGHLGAVDGLAEEAELDERLSDAHPPEPTPGRALIPGLEDG